MMNLNYRIMIDAVENFFNVITLNFISFYLDVLRDGNPVAGLQIFEWIKVEWIKHFL